jgi:hypothetical protein
MPAPLLQDSQNFHARIHLNRSAYTVQLADDFAEPPRLG